MRLARAIRDALENIGLFEAHRARDRSRKLLLRCLAASQRAEFDRSRAFRVRGQSGQVYRILYGTTANVEVLGQTGKVDWRLCAGPVGLPVPSVMLAQKLMLETQEAEFLRIAARSAGAGDPLGYPGR